jgi:uncharacterized membrane protein YqjE
MAGQTTMNGTRSIRNHPQGLIGGVSEFGGDLAELANLQTRLAVCDAQESLKRLTPTLIMAALVLLLLPACVVVSLLGLAFWISSQFKLAIGVSMLSVAGSGLVLCAILGFVAARFAQGSLTSFRRSSEEFQRNLTWVRTVLTQSGR